MKKDSKNRLVVVTGDVTMDWNLARTGQAKRGAPVWSPNDTVDICWHRGGSALLADLLEAISADLLNEKSITGSIRQPAIPKVSAEAIPGDPKFHQSFAIWSEKKYAEKPPLDRERAWRMDEFLGMRRAESPCPVMKVVDDSSEADIVVLDDDDLGFRNTQECWPLAVNMPGNPSGWFVLKMARPVAQGSLWEHLHRQHADRLVVVTTAYDLRLTEVQISRELSWERTAQDVFWELIHNPCVNSLSHCAHVIISFGAAGAILLSRQATNESRCLLFFDPRSIEGTWESGYPGMVIGYTSCLTAGIVRQLMLSPNNPDIPQGIQSGLAALRNLHSDGYGEKGKTPVQSPLVFPFKRIASILGQEKSNFAMVAIQDPLRFIKQPAGKDEKPVTPGFWTILQDRYQGTLDQVAEQIVRSGPETALQEVPLGQFGNLLTVDRQEIESFRSIRTLVGEYCQQGQQKRPLSIAVFGAPGSGKSFGIVEVANSLLPGQIEVREFNLSQFAAAGDLISALHQVRDIGLSGKIPLIFWDEFDTTFNGNPLGWLRYFLAPMQDGRFQEGQIGHPIGRSIFVFAGGTSICMADFGGELSVENFRAVKGPDFVSRLKGYVNILGPNPVRSSEITPVQDPYFVIRRAILLRSILKRNVPDLFEKDKLNIDSGVLRALMKTREYRHGVRSIESIIAMSQLAGKKSFERSSLPSEAQLDLHVDGQNFLVLVQQLELSGKVLEDLSGVAHEIYCEGLKSRGESTYATSVNYKDLPENFKEQNRQNVRDIPIKLASAGYAMIPARSNEPPFNFPGDSLEFLAEREHERWMQVKLADGWKYAPETDKDKKLNHCLVPWNELPDDEKEKDRDMVRGIPKMLARGGYAVVKTHG
ncbi:MAG: hypothetical protein A2X25_00695 [Chloroflexi bacterium GWB2_49_20]|nr:MAG: hypothetical protein A2X25_00695 [Chloroflexi bacterium GWB2_49_20]OGN80194.1 MAG: hypothetical protein A2X26_09550 [Chloroflexi bacterium GWC2_49_37]OGN83167.1 MAG: hypothetical protein A2X27_13310 [Chloroflexi bacterium GWD2_49_16]